jgi:hypothetical protein
MYFRKSEVTSKRTANLLSSNFVVSSAMNSDTSLFQPIKEQQRLLLVHVIFHCLAQLTVLQCDVLSAGQPRLQCASQTHSQNNSRHTRDGQSLSLILLQTSKAAHHNFERARLCVLACNSGQCESSTPRLQYALKKLMLTHRTRRTKYDGQGLQIFKCK